MNPIFSRTLKALCAVVAAALLSGCGGASSTVDPFVATRVIAFGDGFNYVDSNGYGLSTVRTSETTNTLAGRIAERYGIVVKDAALASSGGFSYASANAKVSDVATQINTFLTASGGVVAKKDLIIIAVGNWDIKAAAATNDTAAINTATSALVTAIQRLTNAGAEHVVVIPSTNMARTPWATSSGLSRTTIQNLSNSAATSFNFTLNTKLGDAYRQDRKPVLLLDPTTDYNSFAGSVDVNGNAVRNFSGIVLNNLSTAVCTTSSPATGCTTSVGVGGVLNGTDYLTAVFADEINLTPVINRYLADRMLFTMKNIGWAP
jgi:hypothetical protein